MMTQDLFNDYIVHFGNEQPHDIPSMICKCSPECDYYVYGIQFSNVPLHNMNDIMLDVHYIGQTSFRYKTDIVITQMDLLGKFFAFKKKKNIYIYVIYVIYVIFLSCQKPLAVFLIRKTINKL